MCDARASAGFTLIELMISLGVGSLVLLMSLSLLNTATDDVLTGTVRTSLREDARNMLEGMRRELTLADRGSFTNGPDSLSYRFEVGNAGPPVWSALITYRLEPEGEDIDRDGDTLEMRLERVEDGVVTRSVGWIDPGGLEIERENDAVTVTVLMFRPVGERVVATRLSTTALMKNGAP